MKVKPDLSFWKLWNISFGFFGVQIAYALQSANISRIFATLGADPHSLSYFWILPPLAGIIVQPIVGAASDKTWTRFGRRIPYLFVGSLVAVLVMCLLPNAGSFGMAVSTAMIFGLVSLMFLDTSINMAMQPFKMMVGDMVNEKQKGLAYSIQSFLCNAGSLVGFLFPFIFTWIGISNIAPQGVVPDSVIYSFYIGAAILILCVIYTTVKVKEMPPAEYAEYHGITEEEEKEKIRQQNQEFSMEGLRVLAFTYREIPEKHVLTTEDENHLVFLGLIAMMDPPREESKAAVEECKCAGIRPIMITGDHKVTAAAIAKRIGILENESEACEGAEIDKMSDEELKDFVEGISVYARVSPEHKIRIVRAWQEKGNIVSMTGDGVNDAPALKQADIGVAMGITGSEVSKDAAAMVLTDDNFATIIKAVENGRNVYRNIKASIQFLLSGNFGAILAVLYASLMALPVPFAPVHLLFINLLTDSLPAIALGLEPHSKNVMKEKPRPINESILTKDFLINIGLEGLSICTMVMIAFTIGYKDGNALLASTMAFATLCMSRLLHGFSCKADHPVLFTSEFFNNKFGLLAFAAGMVLINLVLWVPGLHGLFQIADLSGALIAAMYGLSLASMLAVQVVKAIVYGASNRKKKQTK